MSPIPLDQGEVGVDGQCPPFSPVSGAHPHSLREDPEITFQTNYLHPNSHPRACLPTEASSERAGLHLQKSLPSHRHEPSGSISRGHSFLQGGGHEGGGLHG